MRLGRYGARASVMAKLVDQCRELHDLPDEPRAEALRSLSATTRAAIEALRYEWYLWARPEQLAPESEWRWWVMCGGRGSGKTRAAAEEVHEWADTAPGCRIAILGKDANSVNSVMLGGESGLLSTAPPWFTPRWYKSDKLLVWPNGSRAELLSSEEPQKVRGRQYHRAWITELFHFTIPRRGEEPREPIVWKEGLKFGLRLGTHGRPRGIVDSTPRATEFCASFLLGKKDGRGERPVTNDQVATRSWSIEHDVKDHEGKPHRYVVEVRRWRSEDNAANLAPGTIAEWRHDYAGSRLELQELDGIILTKVDGALFSTELLDRHRVAGIPCPLVEVLVAVDPTRATSPTDEAGIIAGGRGENGHVYLLRDATLRGTPIEWASRAVETRNAFSARGIVYEANRMPDKARVTIRQVDPRGKWFPVTATDGKLTRAEPVSVLYAQGLVHHVGPKEHWAKLEDEMISWKPGMSSPNRLDAAVWLVTALKINRPTTELKLV